MRVGTLVDEVLAGPVTFEYWRGEVDELWAEIRRPSLRGIVEEWGDVCALGLAHLVARGWSLRWVPLLPGLGLGSAIKFQKRLTVWARIFDHHGATFRREYLLRGGNYARLDKVRVALAQAGTHVVDVNWLLEERIVERRDGGSSM